MISATVEAGDSGTEYLNKSASELQENIKIINTNISGTLHKVNDFVDFNPDDPFEQSGHYLVLKLTSLEEATIKTKIIGGTKPEVTVDDGFCVYRIKDKKSQKIQISTTKGESTATIVYDLSRLILEEG